MSASSSAPSGSDSSVRPLTPPPGPIDIAVRPPGSKSLSNRAAIVASLADGVSMLSGVLDSEDTRVMRDALDRLGLTVELDPRAETLRIEGQGGRFPNDGRESGSVRLDLRNSGTSIRFLTAACAAAGGDYVLTGNARMQERPIADLAAALRQGGADVAAAETGCPPVTVRGGGLTGGEVTVRGDLSSQFLSGLLMAAPRASGDVTLRVEGELVSRPYVDMTLAVMRAFEADVTEPQPNTFLIRSQPYITKRTTYEIEPDASAASYWLAAGALAGRATVQRLDRDSLQGDIRFADVLERMGARVEWKPGAVTVSQPEGGRLHGIDIDMGPISDTAQTAAVAAVFADSPTRIRGVEHMRHKETDRVAALVTELRRLGIEADEHVDGLTIHPGVPVPKQPIATYDDHRMAMAFALTGLMTHGIEIADPGCVGKTYPRFWDDWDKHIEGQ